GFYRDNGYLRARVDNPEIRTLEDSSDRKIRYVELRIPVIEGPRYRIGEFTIADNKVVKSEALQTIFQAKKGDFYSEKTIRKGFDRTRELYGTIGYFESTAYPDFKFRDIPDGQLASDVDGRGPATAAASGPAADAAGVAATTTERPWKYGKLLKLTRNEPKTAL